MEEEVLFNVENSFGIIKLNRPKTLNALTMNMIEKMRQTFTDWMTNDDIKAVIIKGAGCLLYTSPSPRDVEESRMPSSA